ncbi:FeoB-associated Cys-rich membrane protein [Staphylococcus caprae]|uniref:FeoB-associated Cys-rich membrane protein n=1 Tax=Staphylococcus TaxID=1279 RepID=UPI00091803D0|nr:FeoB-associated Cys-rich membrane protein [Staphylococcus sp. HMSC62A08]OHS41454.1 virus attachment protein p12 family protein [Staphylococcus sp. HMSC62A08]
MYIAINIIICLAIFGYTVMSLYKFFKRSKSGQCGGCKTGCQCDHSASEKVKPTHSKI